MVNRDLALDLDLFSRGGLEILRAIERRDYDVLSARPGHFQSAPSSRSRCAPLSGKMLPFLRLGSRINREGGLTQDIPSRDRHWTRAYAACRAIAKREAKNFYYAFVALPEPRRNAICAIYAFMRKADDLADDESLPREERRAHLDAWLAAWHAAASGGATRRSGLRRRARRDAALQDSAQPAR